MMEFRVGLSIYSLAHTKDQSLVKTVMASQDWSAKSYLALNPNLSHADFQALAAGEPYVRQTLAKNQNVPLDILDMLLADDVEDVRFYALSNPRTSEEDFHTAIRTGKLSVNSKRYLACNVKAVSSFEVFDILWRTKSVRSNLIGAVKDAMYDSAPVDIMVFDTINNYMRSGEASKSDREAYASALYADPEILDKWKSDPYRPIINAIAANGAAWVSTHEYLVDTHKTSSIRISIARVTKDKDLLSKIYYGTKSTNIRESVMKNPSFTS